MKIKSKKPNIFWNTFNLETWACPILFFDFGRSKHSRHSVSKVNKFNYDKDEFWIRLGSCLISENILEIVFTPNQKEYIKFCHQEWEGIKTIHKGALFK